MPYIAGIVVMGISIYCAVHAVRTGRPLYWLFIILGFPLLGSLVYMVSEIAPSFAGNRARKAMGDFKTNLDPDRNYRMLVEQLETADTAENKRALAEELVRLGRPGEAITLYEDALQGVYKDDPVMMVGLARAQFAANEFAHAGETLERLKAANPKFESADAHLLYARCLEGQGRLADARLEYDAVARYFLGAEAKCRYALLLEFLGEPAEARVLFKEVVRGLDKAGRAFIRDQREWYDLAKRKLG
jgi:hypothetical protein